jgi:hypothetical protein
MEIHARGRAGVEEHSGMILTNAARPGPPCHRTELRCDTGMAGETRHTGQLGLPPPKEGSA